MVDLETSQTMRQTEARVAGQAGNTLPVVACRPWVIFQLNR